jgi:hypothetical protein
MVVDYDGEFGTPAGTIRAYLKSGYHGGAWDGSGIMSSAAGANVGRAVGYGEAGALLGLTGGATRAWNGQTVDATSVLLRYTLAGDATLDGVVDFNDLVALARNYNLATNSNWTGGDFTYDDVVDFNDLVKLAQNYNKAMPSDAVPGATAAFKTDLAAAFASVPEPGVGLVVGIVTMGLARRRRRRFEG